MAIELSQGGITLPKPRNEFSLIGERDHKLGVAPTHSETFSSKMKLDSCSNFTTTPVREHIDLVMHAGGPLKRAKGLLRLSDHQAAHLIADSEVTPATSN